jgi:hypothetical protein
MPIISSFGAGSKGGFGRGGALAPVDIDYLVIAGGAGGGAGRGGGGGSGGYRTSFPGGTQLTLEGGASYTITVGAGGTGRQNPVSPYPISDNTGVIGNPSSFEHSAGTLSSTGGGAERWPDVYMPAPNQAGANGGSGGGAQGRFPEPAGTGNAGGYTPSEGNPGGSSSGGSLPIFVFSGGGGGGAGGAGSPNPGADVAGPGGNGSPSTITGSDVTRAGGGGGGVVNENNPPTGTGTRGNGGSGGGGPGGQTGPTAPEHNGSTGTVSTGSGGGASGGYPPIPGSGISGNGGSGIIIVRGPADARFTVTPGTNTITTAPGGEKIATFTVSGTLKGGL